ncbi:MAG: helix-turn-helix transcriptional regulator [Rickettsiales bacterium]|nr:helix-turn-helix transcriptional regulator [Rickettsiales bacterium]
MDKTKQFQKSLISALKAERASRGLSHEKIAEKAGISRQTLGKIESGKTNPTMLTMFKIVGAMDMTLEEFVGKMKV